MIHYVEKILSILCRQNLLIIENYELRNIFNMIAIILIGIHEEYDAPRRLKQLRI